jgi:hypothetical protein
MNDIALSGYPNWDPIGSFSGILDCQNYRINNMTINRNEGLLGLFERVDGIVKIVLSADLLSEQLRLHIWVELPERFYLPVK